MLSIATAERSFVGGRSTNEDCIAVVEAGRHLCLVLSDGAGGHARGAVAARLAVDKVVKGFRARPPVDAGDLGELLLDAHDTVLAAQRGGSRAAMHATIVVLTLDTGAGTALWGHVGDSRLYMLRDGALHAVTRDHSVVQWMLDAGYLDAEQAAAHPNKNRLLAALGADVEIQPAVQPEPLALREGDAFLLCTDGWWDGLADGDIETGLGAAATVDDWIDTMASAIAARAPSRHDNYSAIGCWIGRAQRAPATVAAGTRVNREST